MLDLSITATNIVMKKSRDQHWKLIQNISFQESKSQTPEGDDGGVSEEQFFKPEPYQQERNDENSSENSFENFSEKSENSNLWQNLMDAPKRSQTSKPETSSNSDFLNSDIPTSTLGIATDRMDDGVMKQVICFSIKFLGN